MLYLYSNEGKNKPKQNKGKKKHPTITALKTVITQSKIHY